MIAHMILQGAIYCSGVYSVIEVSMCFFNFVLMGNKLIFSWQIGVVYFSEATWHSVTDLIFLSTHVWLRPRKDLPLLMLIHFVSCTSVCKSNCVVFMVNAIFLVSFLVVVRHCPDQSNVRSNEFKLTQFKVQFIMVAARQQEHTAAGQII